MLTEYLPGICQVSADRRVSPTVALHRASSFCKDAQARMVMTLKNVK